MYVTALRPSLTQGSWDWKLVKMQSSPASAVFNNNNSKSEYNAEKEQIHSLCRPQRQMRWTAWDGVLSPKKTHTKKTWIIIFTKLINKLTQSESMLKLQSKQQYYIGVNQTYIIYEARGW